MNQGARRNVRENITNVEDRIEIGQVDRCPVDALKLRRERERRGDEGDRERRALTVTSLESVGLRIKELLMEKFVWITVERSKPSEVNTATRKRLGRKGNVETSE